MLDVERLNTYRGPAHVLHNLSLTVGDRESVCLVGRNGAGKTTTIDSIMGLLPVKSGRIAFAGQDITRLPTHKRALAGIGYSPEDAGIFPDLTVAENFLISQSLARSAGRGAGPVSADNGIDERVLGLFPEIRTFTGRRGLFLSGGQKKMVAIWRAMTLSPTILLLDEPFERLAPVAVIKSPQILLELIRDPSPYNFAEAYVHSRLDFEGDLFQAMDVANVVETVKVTPIRKLKILLSLWRR